MLKPDAIGLYFSLRVLWLYLYSECSCMDHIAMITLSVRT